MKRFYNRCACPLKRIGKLALMWVFLYLMTACQPVAEQAKLSQIKQKNTIKVGILFNPTSYYVDVDGVTGFEYDLVNLFGDYLGVNIEFVPSYHVGELLTLLENKQVDVLAGGLTKTQWRNNKFKYSPAYMYIDQKLVYKQGGERPTSLEELKAPVTVAAATSHYEKLLTLKQQTPFDVEINTNSDPSELLEMLMDEEIKYTVADSNNLAVVRRYFPDISVAFTLNEKQPLTWLLPNDRDDSLYSVLIDFFGQLHQSGELATLEERYFGHVETFNYVDTRLFMKAVEQVLPNYLTWFKEYANGLDWRLIAAQSYQESHWDPKAKSPTGVRGIMMLTQPTAKQLGVTNRLDPESNIEGGARYLQQLISRVPARISEHDRPWFALAAYNVGWGHVEDARKLAANDNADPDKWVDVQKYLPLLRKKRFYKKTKYGFARGDEAVTYVTNIRRYYDTLVWIDKKNKQEQRIETRKDEVQSTD